MEDFEDFEHFNINYKQVYVGQKVEQNKIIYTLKNNSYLSDFIIKLPHGIINKFHTGIGATTLELKSNRSTIIVQPLKVTASLKAKTSKRILYVGSPTKQFPDTVTDHDIITYINSYEFPNKKIIVVIDSLPRLYELLKQENKISNYFLMIDESDSLQLDSDYRDSMEKCIDIYKLFPINQRCLISATPILHYDPEISAEKKTGFEYENASLLRDIIVTKSKNLVKTIIEKIQQIQKQKSTDKIVVAYNNVTLLYQIAKEVEDAKILCSLASKSKAKEFFIELSNDKLPSKVVLKTSAYFSGFDINESYHLIVAIDPNIDYCMPSINVLKQIEGRCRDPYKILSYNIVVNEFGSDSKGFSNLTVEKLFEAAEIELRAQDCFKTAYSNSDLLQGSILNIAELINTKTKILNYNLLKKNINGEMEISYLSISGILHKNKVLQTLYRNETDFKTIISDNYNANFFKNNYEVNDRKIDKKNPAEKIDRITNHLQLLKKNPKSLYIGPKGVLEEHAFICFTENQYNFNKDQLIELIVASIQTNNSRIIKKLRIFLHFHKLDLKSKSFFSLNAEKRYSKKEIFAKVVDFLTSIKQYNATSNITRDDAFNLFFDNLVHHKRMKNDDTYKFVRFKDHIAPSKELTTIGTKNNKFFQGLLE